MYRITNKEQLKVAYVLLRYYEKNLDRSKLSDIDLIDEHIKEVKREIRAYRDKALIESRFISDEGIDGYTVLEPLPERIASRDAAEAYFDDAMYIPEPRSMYDCTGRPFTVWHKIICRNGRYWCYHHVAFDV